MRIGNNPEKINNTLNYSAYHRVVVPVYIPNFEGYFKDAFDIFKLNIESLLLTIHDKTRISIYNNNSAKEVKIYIDELYANNKLIDQVFHSKENLGKINAILACVKGNLEPLITISDSDVLFKHDWQSGVEEVFLNFPNAGMVSPVPSSTAIKNFTANNWYLGLFGNVTLRFEEVLDPIAMKKFDESLGNGVPLYSAAHLEKYLVLNSKGKKAVMGCGHFVATLRREVFDKGSNSPAFIKITGGVEGKYIDQPNEDLGFLRLATLKNYAFHLGNVKENWMLEEFNNLKKRQSNSYTENVNLFETKPLIKARTVLGKLVKKIILSNLINEKYFNRIGLVDAKNYLK
jgi:hypothetical protein